jgi:hypothetical protein
MSIPHGPTALCVSQYMHFILFQKSKLYVDKGGPLSHKQGGLIHQFGVLAWP